MAGEAYKHSGPQQGPPMPPPPRPPRKSPYRDGVTKSAQYYDLYEMVRRPTALSTFRPPDPPPYASDPNYRPPTKQQKIEKKIQKKFVKNNYSLPGNKFQTVGKILKIIFLVLVLPPYLLLYGLPKWVFFDIMPRFTKWIELSLIKMGRRISLFCKHALQKILSPFKKLKILWHKIKIQNQGPRHKSEKKETGFFALVFQSIWTVYNSTFKPLFSFSAFLYYQMFKCAKAIKNFPRAVNDFIHSRSAAGRQYVFDFCLKIKKKVLGLRNTFVERIKKPLCDAYQRRSHAVSSSMSKAFSITRKKIRSVYHSFKTIVLNPMEAVNRMYERVCYILQHGVEKVRCKTVALRKKIIKKLIGLRTWFSEKYIAPVQRVVSSIKVKCADYKNRVARTYKKWRELLRNMPKRVAGKLPPLSRYKPQIPTKVRSAVYEASQHPKRVVKSCMVTLQRYNHAVNEKGEQCQQKIAERVALFKTKFVTLFSPAKKRIMGAVKAFRHKRHEWALRIRLFTAWTSVITKYGMYHVRETAHELGVWLAAMVPIL